MSYQPNALTDFLTRLYATREIADVVERTDRQAQEFYRYLDERGVEHCNFGGFQLQKDGSSQLAEFSGTRLDENFIEEFTAEMAGDDYVMLMANELSDTMPVASFNIGTDFLSEIESYNPRSVPVQRECARHGIGDGVAMIGQSRSGNGEQSRFFGFAFAGDRASGSVIRQYFGELQVASFALLDQMTCRFDATTDGFRYDLTKREQAMLECLSQGMQRAQMAHRYDLSLATVDMHLGNLRRKLDAQTLAEAVAKGFRYGLL